MTFEEWLSFEGYALSKNEPHYYLVKEAWEASAESVVNSKLTPEGYVLVPVEPTEKMIKAGDPLWDHHCTSIYEAMIQAAQEEGYE